MAATVGTYTSVFQQNTLSGQGLDGLRQVRSFGPFAAADLPNGGKPLFVAEQDLDIEQIVLRATTLAGASDLISFTKDASGTAPGAGTAVTDTVELTNAGSGITANVPCLVPELSSGIFRNISAGTAVSVLAAGTIASLVGLVITIVTVPKRSRTSDGGVPHYAHT